MNKYLKQLVELSKIDKEIDSFGPRIEEVKKTLNQEIQKKNELEAKSESLKSEITECELKIRKNELHLAELTDKMNELSKKSSQIKSEKELKALQLEEEISKEQCDFANEEIERLSKIKDERNAQIQEIESKLETVSKEVEEIRKSIEKEIANIEEQRAKVYEQKEKLISKMSQKIMVFYEKIRKWAKNTTVVPVKKQACYGCYMRINDKTYAAVIKSEDIVTCPHCGRILYLEEKEE